MANLNKAAPQNPDATQKTPSLAGLPPYIQKSATGWYLCLKVQPGARKSEIGEESDGRLRIKLAAPAVDNKANAALLEFLADILQVKKNKPVLVAGHKSRLKRVFIPDGADPVFTALFPG